MRKALRRGLLLLCAVSVLAVPAVANGRQLGDLDRSDDGAAATTAGACRWSG